MAQLYKQLKPVAEHSINLYYFDDVLLLISAKQRKKLHEWIKEKTLVVINDRGAITRDDLDEFFESVTK